MDTRHDDIIEPVRIRGAIRVRGDEVGETVGPRLVRTRGAIRTRGAGAASVPRRTGQGTLTLEDLVQELRGQVEGLPLTALLHGWGSQPVQAFLALLLSWLRREDAVWLIPTPGAELPPVPPAVEGAVVLDLGRDTDQRAYRNLVGDLVLFPALEATQVTHITAWRRRARAVIVDGRGPHSDTMLRAACEAELMTYRWSGEAALEEL